MTPEILSALLGFVLGGGVQDVASEFQPGGAKPTLGDWLKVLLATSVGAAGGFAVDKGLGGLGALDSGVGQAAADTSQNITIGAANSALAPETAATRAVGQSFLNGPSFVGRPITSFAQSQASFPSAFPPIYSNALSARAIPTPAPAGGLGGFIAPPSTFNQNFFPTLTPQRLLPPPAQQLGLGGFAQALPPQSPAAISAMLFPR